MSTRRYLSWLAIGCLSVLPFLPGLNYDFVYDDHGVIVENEFLADSANIVPIVTLQTLRDPSIVDSGRPAVILSYFIDRAIWGLNPVGYRITNLLLHAFASILVFMFMSRLIDNRWVALASAVLFAWHPLVIEPVQSPAFREDLLCMCGGMVFLLCAAGRSTSGLRHAASIAGYAIALLSKETAIVLPLVIGATYWLFPDQRLEKRTCPFWRISVVALSVLWIWFTIVGKPVQSVGIEWNGMAFRGLERIWSVPWLVLWYSAKLLVPFPLSVDYVITPVAGFTDLRFLGGAALLLTGVVLVWVCRKKRPAVSLALTWMFLFFVPVSNILPLLNPVADRYAYAMLPGFVLLIITLVSSTPGIKTYAVLAVIAAGYFAASVVRVRDWRDDSTLWRAALNVEPQSARANTWLGLIEKREGRRMEAWEFFSRAEELNPRDPSSTINKAVLVGEMGDLVDAEARLRDVLKQFPDNISAIKNLTVCLRLQGRDAEAEMLDASLDK